MPSRSRFALGSCIAAALLSTAVCGGCASKGKSLGQTLAFWEEVDVDPRGTQAPNLQMEDLKKQRGELAGLAADQQQAKAAELAERYRNESDPILRAQVVRTIAVCGSPAAGETLKAALADSERDVRLAACDAWAAHGGPQAIAMLGQTLRSDKSKDVRIAAARALGKLGPDVVPVLSVALDDPDPALQYRTMQSLRQVSGKDFGDDVAAWREFTRGGAPKEISTVQRMKLEYF
jgi:hypothetical protein